MRIKTEEKVIEKVVKEEVTIKHLAVSKDDLLDWLYTESSVTAGAFAYNLLRAKAQANFEIFHPLDWISCFFYWTDTPQGHSYWSRLSDKWKDYLWTRCSEEDAINIVGEEE